MEKSQDCFFRYVINAPFLFTEGNEFHVKIKGLCRHYFFECPLKGFVFPRMAASSVCAYRPGCPCSESLIPALPGCPFCVGTGGRLCRGIPSPSVFLVVE